MEKKFGIAQKIARFLCVALVGIFFFQAPVALAASLYLSPSSGSFAPQQAFTVNVYASSTDQVLNAVSGTITFPPSLLQVTGLSKAGSMISLWAQEPSYSNTAGTVSFEGIVLNPGYSGAAGKVLSITFSPTVAGSAPVSFSGGSVLANDGLGTNILNGFGSASFTITDASEATSDEETPAQTGLPGIPGISSSTHPDPSAWYAVNDAVFSWNLPSGITGVNVLADKNPTTNPGTTSDGLRASYTYTDVDDGAWYFHVRLLNASGWGGVAHFAFNIDAQGPIIESVTEIPPSSGEEPTRFSVVASDVTSGIASYAISIDGGTEEQWIDDGTGVYTPLVQDAGSHTFILRAIDAAGNSTSFPEVKYIRTASVVTEVPQVFGIIAPEKIEVNAPFVISGTGAPDTTMIVWIQAEGDLPENIVVRSDGAGAFSATVAGLESGSYRAWAQTTGTDGSLGVQSSMVDIKVFDPVLRAWIFGVLMTILVLVALGIALRHAIPLLISFFVWVWKKIQENQYRRSERAIRKAARVVAKDVARQVRKAKHGKGSKRSISLDIDKLEKQFSEALKNLRKTLGP